MRSMFQPYTQYSQKSLLEQIAERLPGAKRYSTSVWGLCPFHGDSRPSLKVTVRGYSCKACGAKGSLRKLLRKLRNYDAHHYEIQQAKGNSLMPNYNNQIMLNQWFVDAHTKLIKNEYLQGWIYGRGFDIDVIYKCLLGYYRQWYTIPFLNSKGDIIGGSARSKHRKAHLVPEKQPPILYIPDYDLWQSSEKVYVPFGLFDAITLMINGYGAASPSAGLTLLPEWFDDVRKLIYFIPDRGERWAAMEIANKLGWRGQILEIDYPEGTKDLNDCLQVRVSIDELMETAHARN